MIGSGVKVSEGECEKTGGDKRKTWCVKRSIDKERKTFLGFYPVWSAVVFEVFFSPAAFIEIWTVNRQVAQLR